MTATFGATTGLRRTMRGFSLVVVICGLIGLSLVGCSQEPKDGDLFKPGEVTESCVLGHSPDAQLFAFDVIDRRELGSIDDLELTLIAPQGISLAADPRLFDIVFDATGDPQTIPDVLATGALMSADVVDITRVLTGGSIASGAMTMLVVPLKADVSGGSISGLGIEYTSSGKRHISESKNSFTIAPHGKPC